MKTKTKIKSGGYIGNHNETLVRGQPKRGLKVRTGIKSGGYLGNHNEILVRS